MTLIVVILCLTVYRITHLIADDHFPPIQALRDQVATRFGNDSSITYLSTCQWCISVYVGAAVTLLTDLIIGVPAPLLVWGASSAVAGFLSAVEP